jgi:hypothetical protein
MLPNTKSDYLAQWGTLFILTRASKTLDANGWKRVLTPLLTKDWEIVGTPSVFTSKYKQITNENEITTYLEGPWKGRNYSGPFMPFIMAVKWTVRKKDHSIPGESDASKFRTNFRASIKPILSKLGIEADYNTLQNSALLVRLPFDNKADKGLPPNPPIPAEAITPKPKPKPVPTPKPKPVPVIIPEKVKDNRAWIVGLILGFVAAYNM